ncbi:hypothetical protein [Bradyrhizobium sp. SSUT77]|uniref:hypothetical protein n=1 Tax=Bradyrhizobium sp. SSUT77 TaxID=3040603 RepID=UPI00244CE2E2|nr:hypothetical protein [Bradyrhizobium sp. SSUT77]MDH2345441.1 hypothetical protein [Bradyrhizobium sp. SSUT77]
MMAAIAIAYITTGALYIWRDFRKPVDKQPSYVKWGGIRTKLFIVLYWLPGTLSAACRGGVLRDLAVPWAIFAALTVAGLYFSSR